MADIAKAYQEQFAGGRAKRERTSRLVTVKGGTGVGDVQVRKSNCMISLFALN